MPVNASQQPRRLPACLTDRSDPAADCAGEVLLRPFAAFSWHSWNGSCYSLRFFPAIFILQLLRWRVVPAERPSQPPAVKLRGGAVGEEGVNLEPPFQQPRCLPAYSSARISLVAPLLRSCSAPSLLRRASLRCTALCVSLESVAVPFARRMWKLRQTAQRRRCTTERCVCCRRLRLSDAVRHAVIQKANGCAYQATRTAPGRFCCPSRILPLNAVKHLPKSLLVPCAQLIERVQVE